jgi:hypothetical protein
VSRTRFPIRDVSELCPRAALATIDASVGSVAGARSPTNTKSMFAFPRDLDRALGLVGLGPRLAVPGTLARGNRREGIDQRCDRRLDVPDHGEDDPRSA